VLYVLLHNLEGLALDIVTCALHDPMDWQYDLRFSKNGFLW